MATIDRTGIQTLDLSQHYANLETKFKDTFGEDLSTDSETAQGQIIGITAETLAEIDEAFAQLNSAFGINSAGGSHLDDLFSLADVTRKTSTVSTVTATLTGVAGTTIPAGSRAKTTSGDEFALRRDALIPAGGSVEGIFAATRRGAITIAANTLTQIVTVVNGWETINNPQAGVEGVDSETDSAFRTRGKNQLAQNATGTSTSLQAALTKIGVSRSRIIDNDSSAAIVREGLGSIAAHAIAAIVEGGLDNDVAQAIADNKTLGSPTHGSSNGTTSDGRTIRFTRVAEFPIALTLTVTTNDLFPNDGVNLIKRALVDFADSNFHIGEGVDTEQLRVPIYSVLGVSLNTINVTNTAETPVALPSTTPLNRLYTLAAANISITTS